MVLFSILRSECVLFGIIVGFGIWFVGSDDARGYCFRKVFLAEG